MKRIISVFVCVTLVGCYATWHYSQKNAQEKLTNHINESREVISQLREENMLFRKQLVPTQLRAITIDSISIKNKSVPDIISDLWKFNKAQLDQANIGWVVSTQHTSYRVTTGERTEKVYLNGSQGKKHGKYFDIELKNTNLLAVIDYLCTIADLERLIMVSPEQPDHTFLYLSPHSPVKNPKP